MEERKRESLRTPWRPKYFIPEVTLACYQALALIKVTSTFIVETVGQTGATQALRGAGQSVALVQVGGWNLGSRFPSKVLASHTILRADACS